MISEGLRRGHNTSTMPTMASGRDVGGLSGGVVSDGLGPQKCGKPRQCAEAFAHLLGVRVSLLQCVGIALIAPHRSDMSCLTK